MDELPLDPDGSSFLFWICKYILAHTSVHILSRSFFFRKMPTHSSDSRDVVFLPLSPDLHAHRCGRPRGRDADPCGRRGLSGRGRYRHRLGLSPQLAYSKPVPWEEGPKCVPTASVQTLSAAICRLVLAWKATSGELDFTTLTSPRDLMFQDTDPAENAYGGTRRRDSLDETRLLQQQHLVQRCLLSQEWPYSFAPLNSS